MSIIGIVANGVFAETGGNIVGSQGPGSTLTHHFGSSSIWAHPALQSFSTQSDNESDQPGASVVVSQFKDAAGTHNVNSIGIFANKCTSVTYQMTAVDGGSGSALCITEFLD
jgi:hypothetical protein